MLVIITKSHCSPLPTFYLISKLPEQLQAGFLVQQHRPLFWHLWSSSSVMDPVCVCAITLAACCGLMAAAKTILCLRVYLVTHGVIASGCILPCTVGEIQPSFILLELRTWVQYMLKACRTTQMHTSVAVLHEQQRTQQCFGSTASLHSCSSSDSIHALRLMMSLGCSGQVFSRMVCPEHSCKDHACRSVCALVLLHTLAAAKRVFRSAAE